MNSLLRPLTDVCRSIVTRGSDPGPTSERAYYAHCLSSKATLHAESILALCDATITHGQVPDVGAICVLARCIVEARNTAAYLLEGNISKHEAHFRLRLFSLNQSVDLSRINRGMETSRDNFWSEYSVEHDRKELEANPIFAALDADHKKTLLRGRSPFQHARYRGKRPLSVAQESAIYTLLSHSAHSFGLGLSPFAGYGRGTPAGQANAFFIATATAELYLADTTKTYRTFRRRAIGELSEEELVVVEQAADPTHVLALFKSIRAGAAL